MLIVVDHDGGSRPKPGLGGSVLSLAAARGMPLLVVVDDPADPNVLVERLVDADDWVSLGGLATEMPVRVARLLRRRGAGAGDPKRRVEPAGTPVLGPRFLPLVVHDLRAPLNVIGLSLAMLNQALPANDAEVAEDMQFIQDNVRQLDRMLSQLSDYYRLHESEDVSEATTVFSPGRLVDELLEARLAKAGARASQVSLEVSPTCPPDVELDPFRARVAIHYAVANAAVAANGEPVRVTLCGRPGRWVTEVVVDHPPPETVCSAVLDATGYERLCGIAAERRGLDLAIAAKVSAQFGGTARLEAEGGRRTAIILDWPTRLASR
jgi:signal transduction histidine kinase